MREIVSMTSNNQENIVVEFEPESKDDSVNVKTVSSTLNALDSITNEIFTEYDKNSEFLLKARPFQKGSFEIPLDLIAIYGATAIPFMPVLKDVLRIMKEYFKIKNLLKGETPKIENNNIIIDNKRIKVDNITVNLIQPDNHSNKLISEAFTQIEGDKSIKNVYIRKEKTLESIAEVSRDQFRYYSILPSKDIPTREITHSEKLTIFSPVFDDKSKWRFIRDGNKISANILDTDFIDKVNKGEPFRSGDKLEVKIQITQEYDKDADCYIDKSFSIIEIIKHIKRLEEPTFFDS